MFQRVLVLLLPLVLSLPGFAADEKANAEAKASYDRLVTALQTGDTSIDFQALRFALAGSPGFVSGGNWAERGSMRAAFRDKDTAKGLSIAMKILEADYTDIEAHLACRMAHDSLGDAAKAKFHLAVARGLVLSIISSGDGHTAKTAMTVISIPEEHMAMGYLRLKPQSQALVQEDGRMYDCWDAEDQDGKTIKVYFNIDKFFGLSLRR